MRNETLHIDPSIEHSFSPGELFDLLDMMDRIEVPVSFMRDLTRAQSMTEALDSATECLCAWLGVKRASIALSDGQGLLQIWARAGDELARLDKSVSATQGRIGRAFQSGRLIISSDLKVCPEHDSRMLLKAGYRRALNAPISFGGVCLGTLNIGTYDLMGLGLREAFAAQCVTGVLGPALAAFQSADASTGAIAEAEAMRRRAESESAAKSSFIANVSHEIRTPMNAIMGMAKMLAEDDLTPDQAEKIETLLYSADSLTAIMNDVLDLSKIEAGKLVITPVRNRVREVFARCVEIWRDRASQHGAMIDLQLGPATPETAIFDAVRVQQCLSNLLSNAVKFTRNGRVWVKVDCDAADDGPVTFHVSVQDEGAGIEPAELDRLFEPFEQGGGSVGGTGLGLSISRRLAELMGGGLHAVSQPGEGSVFTFRFRAGAAKAIHFGVGRGGPMRPEPELRLREGLKILLAEDVPTNRYVVRAMLASQPVTLCEVENGAEALARLDEEAFDLLLLDMNMPVLDGPGTIAALRARTDATGRIPVLTLTADAMAGDRERCLKLGINGYLPKPLDRDRLVAEIARLTT